MLNGLNLACARRLEQAQAVACNLLGILVALPLVIDFQAGPFIGIHSLDVGSLELAVGCRLRREQRRVRPVDSRFSISAWFSVSMGTHGSADVSSPYLMLNRIESTVSGILRAAGNCHRADNDRDGQKLADEYRQAQQPQPRLCRLAAIVSIMRWTRDHHAHESDLRRGKLQRSSQQDFAQQAR
jgi:hypothetical protein